MSKQFRFVNKDTGRAHFASAVSSSNPEYIKTPCKIAIRRQVAISTRIAPGDEHNEWCSKCREELHKLKRIGKLNRLEI